MKVNPLGGKSSIRQRNVKFAVKKMGAARCLALFVVVTLACSVAASVAPAVAQNTGDQGELQLAVIPLAQKLPADGGEYPFWIQLQTVRGSSPIQAQHDIDVTLTVSGDTIHVAQDALTIEKGQSMVMANVITTEKPGISEITAMSEGISFGKAPVSTVKLGSLEPSILALHAGSGKFIPNPAIPGKVYVQLLNSASLPAATKQPLTVYLSSSDPQVGKLPTYVTIPAGAAGITVDFTTTFQQGSATLTASANGFTPGKVDVRTVGPVGTKLVIEFAPARMPAPIGYYSFFTVQIMDSADIPVKANKQTVVRLTSSNANVAEVPSEITIAAGSSYATERVRSKGTIGDATITASAQGFASSAITIKTVAPNFGDPSAAKMIRVNILPSKITPDNVETANVIVQVTDMSGRPYQYQDYLYNGVVLHSSDPTVGTVGPLITRETTFAVGSVKSSFYYGTTAITASGNGFVPGTNSTDLKGYAPIGLNLSQMQEVVLADNRLSGAAIVGLVDQKGNPAFAQNPVLIGLSSSSQEVATIEPTELIPAGQSYAVVEFYPTSKAGSTVFSAFAQGLASSSITVKTVGGTGDSSPYKLAVRAVPELLADARAYDAVFVQLQDPAGNPVPAKSDIRVNLSSSSVRAASIENSVTIEKGSSFALAKLTPTDTPSKFTITASSTGYATVSTEVTTSAQPLTIVRTSDLPRTAPFDSIPVAVDVFAGGIPLANATIEVGGATAKPTQAITDANGHAEAMYVPTQPGKNTILVTASKPGYKLTTASYVTSLEQTVAIYAEAKTEAGKPIGVQAKISGPGGTKTVSVKPGAPAGVDDVKWGTYTISVPGEFSSAGAIYQFTSWSDGVTANPRIESVIGDSGFTAIYSAQFLLTADTEIGTAIGAGYYAEGETATISISPTTFEGFPIDKSFASWSGDVQIASANAEIVMDGPKTIKAEWNTSYLKLIVILGVAAGGGYWGYYKVIKPKRDAIEKARAPDLDWYKT